MLLPWLRRAALRLGENEFTKQRVAQIGLIAPRGLFFAVVVDVQRMQRTVKNRCQDETGRRDQDDAAEEGVEAGEEARCPPTLCSGASGPMPEAIIDALAKASSQLMCSV